MSDIEKVKECVREYERTYRHSDLEPLTLSPLYDLSTDWHEQAYPDATRPGVYLIYDENEGLLYIGKASLNNTLGARLGSYFQNDPETVYKTTPGHSWTRHPRYVQTIPVPNGFEAPSVEEYLITTLRPVDNTRGT